MKSRRCEEGRKDVKQARKVHTGFGPDPDGHMFYRVLDEAAMCGKWIFRGNSTVQVGGWSGVLRSTRRKLVLR